MELVEFELRLVKYLVYILRTETVVHQAIVNALRWKVSIAYLHV